MKSLIAGFCIASTLTAVAQENNGWQGKFEQLGQMLPTPNEYRTGSGAPGPKYWQQEADYVMAVELNDENQSITGNETITYTNNSPESLHYLWVQLDQNILDKDNLTDQSKLTKIESGESTLKLAGDLDLYDFDGGYKITSVKDATGQPLSTMVNHTMMRIDLPAPLASGQKYSFSIAWHFNIEDRMKQSQRMGFEYFPSDNNYIYTIAQFFPRMCVFDDYEGWQNKQFLGRGEFALPFGNYQVKITVPADHIVAATGTLKNPEVVLSKTEQERLAQAHTSFDKPVIIVTEDEAKTNEGGHATAKKTWEFAATNVRDFAFASSRKFIWDAMAVKIGNNTPLAMSYYPKESNPLWERESTRAVKNALEVYSRYSVNYPWPSASSVYTANQGMEYPMICFNRGRPNADGTYTDRDRERVIGVIVHEVGHNFFPMIVNSDERQWTWMDEGLNSFVQYLTETERYPDLNWTRGKPSELVDYMKGDPTKQRPVMTNSEQVIDFGDEQYAKVATGLVMLRQTIMGPELFDKAFKEYSERWAFKHPKPADFFRTMEDASAFDLDWFWRGWFYSTDVVNQSIDKVTWYRVEDDNANLENKNVSAQQEDLNSSTAKGQPFAGGPKPFHLLPADENEYRDFLSRIDDKQVMQKIQGKNLYEVTLTNKGGLVMPVILKWNYADGTSEMERLPAEIWRTNEHTITKVFAKDKEVSSVELDPNQELPDIDLSDNAFPRRDTPSRFDLFRAK